MSAVELTEKERDAMAHCIGHHSANGCSVHGGRNYYATYADDPMWCSLVERGLAHRHGSASVGPDATFHLTGRGVAAVEADPRSQRKDRAYTVRFADSVQVQVYAESHAKARYSAALDVLDAFGCSIGQAFRQIKSCRLSGVLPS